MRTLFHSLVYLALGVWLGALIFFGAILAPLAFSQLPPLFGAQGVHAAGLIVGGSLVRLHWMGLFCGVVFLLVMLLGHAHYRMGRDRLQWIPPAGPGVVPPSSQGSARPGGDGDPHRTAACD